jgi:chromosome segregation ATPase
LFYRIKELQETIDKLNEETKTLQSKLTQENNLRSTLESKLDTITQQHNSTKQQMQQAETETKQLKLELSKTKELNTALKQELQQVENRLVDLVSKSERLSKFLQNKSEANKKLNDTMKQPHSPHTVTVSKLDQHLEEFMNVITDCSQKLKGEQEKSQKLQEANNKLLSEKDKAVQQYNKAIDKIKELQNDQAMLQSQITALLAEVEQKGKTKAELDAQLKDQSVLLQSLSQEVQQLRESVQKHIQEKNKLKQELDNKTHKCCELENQLKQTSSELQSLQAFPSLVQELENKNESIERRVKYLNDENKKLEKVQNLFIQTLEILRDIASVLQEEDLHSEIDALLKAGKYENLTKTLLNKLLNKMNKIYSIRDGNW